jgi:hypothetical protein
MMILSKTWRSLSVGMLVISGTISSLSYPALSGNVDLAEDKLNTEKNLRWGGEGLPFNEVVTIRDSLVNSIVGKVVIDRYGEDNGAQQSTGLLSGLSNALNIRAPFAGPRPGRITIVTLWGSKEEGCFVKAMIRNAPVGDAKVRLTFNNGDTKVFAIGQKNVAQWRESYGYNSTCQAKS